MRLEDDADLGGWGVLPPPEHVYLTAVVRRKQAANHAQERALATAAGAQHGNKLRARDLEGHTFESAYAAVKCLGDRAN